MVTLAAPRQGRRGTAGRPTFCCWNSLNWISSASVARDSSTASVMSFFRSSSCSARPAAAAASAGSTFFFPFLPLALPPFFFPPMVAAHRTQGACSPLGTLGPTDWAGVNAAARRHPESNRSRDGNALQTPSSGPPRRAVATASAACGRQAVLTLAPCSVERQAVLQTPLARRCAVISSARAVCLPVHEFGWVNYHHCQLLATAQNPMIGSWLVAAQCGAMCVVDSTAVASSVTDDGLPPRLTCALSEGHSALTPVAVVVHLGD